MSEVGESPVKSVTPRKQFRFSPSPAKRMFQRSSPNKPNTSSSCSLVKVSFKITHEAQDQDLQMFVSGSCASLGNWDNARARKMEFVSRGHWKLDVYLQEGTVFQYKYVMMNELRERQWEDGETRHISLDVHNNGRLEVFDTTVASPLETSVSGTPKKPVPDQQGSSSQHNSPASVGDLTNVSQAEIVITPMGKVSTTRGRFEELSRTAPRSFLLAREEAQITGFVPRSVQRFEAHLREHKAMSSPILAENIISFGERLAALSGQNSIMSQRGNDAISFDTSGDMDFITGGNSSIAELSFTDTTSNRHHAATTATTNGDRHGINEPLSSSKQLDFDGGHSPSSPVKRQRVCRRDDDVAQSMASTVVAEQHTAMDTSGEADAGPADDNEIGDSAVSPPGSRSRANSTPNSAEEVSLQEQVNLLESDNKRLQADLEVRVFTHNMQMEAMAEQLEQAKSQVSSKNLPQLQTVLGELKAFKVSYGQLRQEVSAFTQQLVPYVGVVNRQLQDQICGGWETVDKELQETIVKYKREAAERRRLYNEVQELKGNIRVFCRSRPLSGEEKQTGQKSAVSTLQQNEITVMNNSTHQAKSYSFDRVYGSDSTQEEVFEDTKPLIQSILDGYNVCIFAYGQTGSGKTFTMEGVEENRGVNYRALQDLFATIESRTDEYSYEMSVSLMEIYNEQIRDLLVDPALPLKNLEVKQRPVGTGNYVPELREVSITSMEEVWDVLRSGMYNRAVAHTNANNQSSRSHCLFTVSISGQNLLSGVRLSGRLHLVDLAGSERVSKSGAEGARMKEAQHINKSLSALGDCISALVAKQKHVPYRNSKLTHLLSDSLGGDSKTLMFCQVSPADTDFNETMCSLKFASRVRNVELGPAKRQQDASSNFMKEMKVKDDLLDKLKGQLSAAEEALKVKKLKQISDDERKLSEVVQESERYQQQLSQSEEQNRDLLLKLEKMEAAVAAANAQAAQAKLDLNDALMNPPKPPPAPVSTSSSLRPKVHTESIAVQTEHWEPSPKLKARRRSSIDRQIAMQFLDDGGKENKNTSFTSLNSSFTHESTDKSIADRLAEYKRGKVARTTQNDSPGSENKRKIGQDGNDTPRKKTQITTKTPGLSKVTTTKTLTSTKICRPAERVLSSADARRKKTGWR